MKTTLHYFFLFAVILAAVCACEKEETPHQHFFLENDGAIMPVWLSGNTQSDTYILVLHGGPGSSAIRGYFDTRLFSELERNYAVLYWDQRCAGLSQGNCDPNDLSVAQYVEDLEKLVRLIKYEYGEDISLFLLGHSWGGTLSMAYALDHDNRQELNGVINTAGPHNIPLTIAEEKAYLMDFAQQMIEQERRAEDWRQIRDLVEPLQVDVVEDVVILNKACYDTEKLLIDMDSLSASTIPIPGRPFLAGLIPSLINSNATARSEAFFDEFIHYDLSAELASLDIPMAVLVGQYDFVIPPTVMQDLFEHLEMPEKEYHSLQHSHHSPMVYEGEAFQELIINFVETYR